MDSSQSVSGDGPLLVNTGKLQTFLFLGFDDYVEMLGDLMREVPEQLERMRCSIQQGDFADCKQCAHSLRGILGYFGCVAMTTRLGQLENRQSLAPEEAATTYAEFQTLWPDSLAAIRQWEKSIPDFAGTEVDFPRP